jgi:hypothetical protein
MAFRNNSLRIAPSVRPSARGELRFVLGGDFELKFPHQVEADSPQAPKRPERPQSALRALPW